jgi:hypothetical protein
MRTGYVDIKTGNFNPKLNLMQFKKGLLVFILWVAVFALAGLTIGAIVTHFSVSDKDSFNSEITKLKYKDGTERLRSDYSGDFIGPRADIISDDTEDDFVIYRRNGRIGYINVVTGKDAIPSIKHNFEYAWDFDSESGLAAVLENGKIGFIRKDGSYQIPPQYPYPRQISAEPDIEFSNGYCVIPSGNKEKYGLIDTGNKLILPFTYDYIGNLEEGYRIVGVNGKYGLLDSLFNMKIQPVYNDMWINSLGVVVLDTTDHSQLLLGFDLKTVTSKYAFDEVSPLKTIKESEDEEEIDYSSENLSGYSTFTIYGKTGVIRNSTGKVIVEAVWDDIEYVADGIFKAELGGKYFLIDATGKFIQ